MAPYYILILFFVAMVTIEARRRGPGPGNRRQQDEAIEKLTQRLEDLEHHLDSIESAGSSDTAASRKVPIDPVAGNPVAAHGSCPNASPIHMHFHGEGSEHNHIDHKDTHVHIDLGLDFQDFHEFNGRHGKQSKCQKCQKKHLDPEEEYSAICVMEPVDDSTQLKGKLEFKQHGKDQTVTISAKFEGLPEGNAEYEMHVHVKADLSGGCSNTGHHFDPFDTDRDVGNLGQVTSSSDKKIEHTFDGVRHSLFGPARLVGRAADVHDANRDRLACCVIGWQHSPHDTADMHGDGQ